MQFDKQFNFIELEKEIYSRWELSGCFKPIKNKDPYSITRGFFHAHIGWILENKPAPIKKVKDFIYSNYGHRISNLADRIAYERKKIEWKTLCSDTVR